jgi:hypothetical protein
LHQRRVARCPANVDPNVAAFHPPELLEFVSECGDEGPSLPVALGKAHQHADPPHPVALLRARCERPRRRAADERDELAPVHSITSSAVAIRRSGTLRPSAFAVFRLIANSYLVGA